MQGEQLTVNVVAGAREGQRVVKLSGPLTMTTLFDFQSAVRAETAPTVILDFSQVSYMDSAGLGAVVNAHISCVNSGRLLALADVPDRVRTLLQLTRVEQVLAIFPTLSDAENSPNRPANA